MANLKINSQSYKAGDIILLNADLYIVTDSTVADLDLDGDNLLIVNLANGRLTVLPEIIPTQKVNVEINIIDWT